MIYLHIVVASQYILLYVSGHNLSGIYKFRSVYFLLQNLLCLTLAMWLIGCNHSACHSFLPNRLELDTWTDQQVVLVAYAPMAMLGHTLQSSFDVSITSSNG